MVCFVLFQGGGAQLSDWEPLVTELKKLGTVFVYQNLAYNVFSYISINKSSDKNLSFNMQYLDMDKHIDLVYRQVSHHKHLIPVAWSAGGYFARAFAQKYPCDRMILIDPVMIEPANIAARYKKIYSDFKKHGTYTNKYLQQIITSVKTKHDLPSAIKMMDLVHSMWTRYAMEHIKPSKIPVLIFYNYKGKKKNGVFSDVAINREIKYLHENEPAIIKTCTDIGHNIFYYNTKWLMNSIKAHLFKYIQIVLSLISYMNMNHQINSINKNMIDRIITDNKLLVSYSINCNDITINKNPNKIYPIHSISKLFTNIILVLLYNDKIINDEKLKMPIKVDEYVLNKLSKDIKNRLKTVSMLQCIKHEAGLKNYMDNYHNKLIDCFNQSKKEFPNPIEPEDFLIYANKDVLLEKEIGKYNYSNLGILLVTLSLKYYYNSINKTNLSYNQILTKYIIDKIKLKSFSITKPKLNSVFPIAQDDLTKYVNGSPATSYWMSSNDLCKFGIWINKLFNSNKKIKKCITENKLDVYWKNPLRLGHWGFLQTSSSCLETYLKKNITIAILSNHNNDAHIFMNKIKKILK